MHDMCPNGENVEIWRKNFFRELFHTRRTGYQTKATAPLSSEKTLLTVPDIFYVLE